MLPKEIICEIIQQRRDDEYLERMQIVLIDIRSTITAFLNTGHNVYPETMVILNHILSAELDKMNAHDYFIQVSTNSFLGRDANGRGNLWPSPLLQSVIWLMHRATNYIGQIGLILQISMMSTDILILLTGIMTITMNK